MDEFENKAFEVDDTIYNKPVESIPKPEVKIGADTSGEFIDDIAMAGQTNQLDMGKLESFTRLSENRNQLYNAIDVMCQDSMIAAVLESYVANATELNDDGRIVWVESDDQDIVKYINYLLDTMSIDKNIYSWAYSLCKYGDVYLRLYRESEYEDPVFNVKADKKDLNEDVIVKAFSKNDRYAHYVEMVKNPAEVFELIRFGKTQGYIKADISSVVDSQQNMYGLSMLQYNFSKKDVEIYSATDFVHGCLEDNSTRVEDSVRIFLDDDTTNTDNSVQYSVRRGRSLFYDAYKAWRELMLLKKSVLLNRVTKSSIVRVVSLEVGDQPKESTQPLLNRFKQLIEQKTALNIGNAMSEYTNPGPVENTVYTTTHNGVGQIATTQIGGDVDVKSLADLDYFTSNLFGALKVPKEFFGYSDDGGGFNAGSALSLMSSEFTKYVKRIQNALIQMITDMVNLMLVDKKLTNYVNKFTIKMQAPVTQDEVARRENVSNRIRVIADITQELDDIDNPVAKLKIKKALLSTVLPDETVLEVLQDEVERLEAEQADGNLEDITDNDKDIDVNIDSGPVFHRGSSEEEPDEEAPSETGEESEEGSVILPSPADLDIDMTEM